MANLESVLAKRAGLRGVVISAVILASAAPGGAAFAQSREGGRQFTERGTGYASSGAEACGSATDQAMKGAEMLCTQYGGAVRVQPFKCTCEQQTTSFMCSNSATATCGCYSMFCKDEPGGSASSTGDRRPATTDAPSKPSSTYRSGMLVCDTPWTYASCNWFGSGWEDVNPLLMLGWTVGAPAFTVLDLVGVGWTWHSKSGSAVYHVDASEALQQACTPGDDECVSARAVALRDTRVAYVEYAYAPLAMDLAGGGGQYADALARLFGMDPADRAALTKLCRERYADIYTAPAPAPAELLANIEREMMQVDRLRAYVR